MITGMDKVNRRLGSSEEIDDAKLAEKEEQEHLQECVDTILKAEEYKQDSMLMEKLAPLLEAKQSAAEAAMVPKSLGDLRKLASKKSLEEQEAKGKKDE